MMKIRIEIRGTAELRTALENALSDELRRDVVDAMATELLQKTEGAFFSERYRPLRWEPLKKSTLRRKKKNTRMLMDTFTMVRGFAVEDADAYGAAIANTQKYAVYHQFGTRRMPARPFVPATGGFGDILEPIPAAKEEMHKSGAAAMTAALRRAGLL